MKNVKIAPSILAADFGKLAEEVMKLEEGGADFVHVDVMDGHFVPNISMGPDIVKAVRRATSLPLDVHLMIEEPDRFLEVFVDAGSYNITVQAEACRHLHRTISMVKKLGNHVGVALNPASPISFVEEILEEVDLFLVMTVNPGFGGQSLIPSTLKKIERLKAEISRRELGAEIEVDGGVKVSNALSLIEAGATILVAGSEIFEKDDYRATIDKLRNPPK
ncbi:MAG: ribulose-phosphate 3-epimerase [Candidatus Tectomicrobia bacterium]|nr:ribulose-phosphate 3-epimerase [Candidatus Tectomicrobia bacterium]